MEQLLDWMAANPQVWAWFTTAVRFLFPVLALLILIRTIRSLLTVPCLPEVWAYLTLPNGAQEPLTHWENILGRGGNSDVILNYPVVSRQHAALIRQADDTWTAYDLGSKGGVTVNGRPVEGSAPVQYGDVVGIGGVETVLLPLSPEEKAQRRQRRRALRPVAPWRGLGLRVPGPHRTPAHHQRGGERHGDDPAHLPAADGGDVAVLPHPPRPAPGRL